MNPQYYQVKVGNYAVDKDEIHHPIGQEDIHIVPVISGAGKGVGKILLGAALIAGAFMLGPTGFMTAEKLTTGVILAKSAVYLGTSLVLSGVSEMLFPLPKPKEFKSEQDPQLSFSFSGTQNTSRAGTPVPIVYGEIVTGSVVISGAIDTQQVQA
jgi:predicted phage tail protein